MTESWMHAAPETGNSKAQVQGDAHATKPHQQASCALCCQEHSHSSHVQTKSKVLGMYNTCWGPVLLASSLNWGSLFTSGGEWIWWSVPSFTAIPNYILCFAYRYITTAGRSWVLEELKGAMQTVVCSVPLGSSVQGLSRSAFQEEDITGDDKEYISHVASAKPKNNRRIMQIFPW